MPDQGLHAQEAAFRAKARTLEKAETRIKQLLQFLCESAPPRFDNEEVDPLPPTIHDVESRVKDLDSFMEKIKRPGKFYKDPINEITDLVGFRIITYYASDIRIVDRILRNNFDVDEKNSHNAVDRLGPNQFGYRSRHYVVKLSPARLALPEFRAFTELKFEIQVRTILEHAWAFVSHKLTYKGEGEAPLELRRRIAMLSAVLELADDNSSELQSLRTTIKQKYEKLMLDTKKRSGSFPYVPIDTESISSYLQVSDQDEIWSSYASDIGWQIEKLDTEKSEDSRRENIRLSELVRIIQVAQIKDIHEFNTLLVQEAEIHKDYLKRMHERLAENGEHLHATYHDILRGIVINAKSQIITTDMLLSQGYYPDLVKVYRDVCNLQENTTPANGFLQATE